LFQGAKGVAELMAELRGGLLNLLRVRSSPLSKEVRPRDQRSRI
jgi:hypothetical protein